MYHTNVINPNNQLPIMMKINIFKYFSIFQYSFIKEYVLSIFEVDWDARTIFQRRAGLHNLSC